MPLFHFFLSLFYLTVCNKLNHQHLCGNNKTVILDKMGEARLKIWCSVNKYDSFSCLVCVFGSVFEKKIDFFFSSPFLWTKT